MTTTINADTVVGGAVVTADASGQLGLQAAGVTKLTVSSSGVTLASALPIASGGTNATATPTAGGAVYGTGTAYAITAAGTSGQVLTSAGASAPTWTTPSAGAMTFIANTTAASASSVNFTVSGYGTYLIQFYGVKGPTTGAAAGAVWLLTARINNTTTTNTAHYGGGYRISGQGTVPKADGTTSASYIYMTAFGDLTFQGTEDAMVNGQMSFFNMNSTSIKYGSGFSSGFSNKSTSNLDSFGSSSAWRTNASSGAATSINIYMWDGTNTTTFTGTFIVYGIQAA